MDVKSTNSPVTPVAPVISPTNGRTPSSSMSPPAAVHGGVSQPPKRQQSNKGMLPNVNRAATNQTPLDTGLSRSRARSTKKHAPLKDSIHNASKSLEGNFL